MNASVSLIFSIFLGIVCAVTALKEGDCEGKNFWSCIENYTKFSSTSAISISNLAVCVAVIDKFSQTLTPEVRSSPKQIEDMFREYCKGTKSKENRFVSIYIFVLLENCYMQNLYN